MQTVSLIATSPYAYAGRSLVAGDTFEASEKDANLLKLIGRAKDAPSSRRVRTRDLTPKSDHSEDDKPDSRRQYNRRDMTPEP